MRLAVRNRGRLPSDLQLGGVPNGVSGLGLIRALLPGRGASLALEQCGPQVVATVELAPPVVTRANAT